MACHDQSPTRFSLAAFFLSNPPRRRQLLIRLARREEVAASMTADTDLDSVPFLEPADGPGPDRNRLFLRLFLGNQRRVYAYILTLLPRRSDADDVLQETSLVLWDKFDPANPPDDFAAWACRIAFHKVLDWHKKAQRNRAKLSRAVLERVSAIAAEQATGPDPDDRWESLAGCIEKLSPRDRDLLARRYAEGATTQSTSDQLGRSVEAVYKALARIRRSLFECVQRSLTRERLP
jgi:RNA polymerase sigma-70 factor (ECF subfamily)